jgi:endonuclease III
MTGVMQSDVAVNTDVQRLVVRRQAWRRLEFEKLMLSRSSCENNFNSVLIAGHYECRSLAFIKFGRRICAVGEIRKLQLMNSNFRLFFGDTVSLIRSSAWGAHCRVIV